MNYRKAAGLALAVAVMLAFAVAASALNRPSQIHYGTATIDGDLSDWSTAQWTPLDQIQDGNPTDIPEAYYAARWTRDKIYVATRVRDTAHHFLDNYADWNLRDIVEVYIHTTGTGNGDYYENQAVAQMYTVGFKASDHSQVWTSLGYGNAVGEHVGLQAAGTIAGQWLNYEVAVTPYRYLDMTTGVNSIVSPLSLGQVIGVDVSALGHDGTRYTGMRFENLMYGKYWNYAWIGTHQLVPEPSALLGLVSGLGGLAILIRRRR